MGIELATCTVCGEVLPRISMSKVDDTICARCASHALARIQREDGSWLDDGLALGILHWEQFPNEPRSAYAVFCIYRDAYPQQMSVKELTEVTGYGAQAIRHWMQRWRWKERFYEWSRYQDKLALVEQSDIRREMNDRQIRTSQSLLQKASERLERIDMDELTPREVLAWVEVAAKLERTAVNDNRELVEAIVEQNSYSVGTTQKQEAATIDKGLEEVLQILAQSGAINIAATISTPTTVVEHVEDEASDVDYTAVVNFEEGETE